MFSKTIMSSFSFISHKTRGGGEGERRGGREGGREGGENRKRSAINKSRY